MHSQIVVNPRFHKGTNIGKGGPVLAAKISPGGPVFMGDRFFHYSSISYKCTYNYYFLALTTKLYSVLK